WLGTQGVCSTGFTGLGFAGHALAQTFSPGTSALGAVAVPLISIARDATPPADGEAWYVFSFDPPLPVTAGATYAIELTDAADRFRWAAVDAANAGCSVSEFAGGEAFFDGVAVPDDFRFATYAP